MFHTASTYGEGMKLILITLVGLVLGLMVACGGAGGGNPIKNVVDSFKPTPTPAPQVIYDEYKTIPDGGRVSIALDAGTYRLELTATGNGVEVLWPGSDCLGQTRETQSYTEICTLEQSGQFSISNPSMLGTGPSSHVTIKVTYLPNQSSSPAAAPQSPSRNQNQPTAVQQRQAPTKKPATAAPQRGRSREATNVPGQVSPGQVAGRISRVADIYASSGSSQSITVTFQNTSDVTTHYRLEDAGRFSGWTVTKKCRLVVGGDCEVQNVGPGDTVALKYEVSAPSSGSATATWVLKAAHTCGLFGCKVQSVDRQSQLLSVR
jgi:hypothetical protein